MHWTGEVFGLTKQSSVKWKTSVLSGICPNSAFRIIVQAPCESLVGFLRGLKIRTGPAWVVSTFYRIGVPKPYSICTGPYDIYIYMSITEA